jgi:hypothetical protein
MALLAPEESHSDESRSGMPPGVSFKNLNLVRDAEY